MDVWIKRIDSYKRTRNGRALFVIVDVNDKELCHPTRRIDARAIAKANGWTIKGTF